MRYFITSCAVAALLMAFGTGLFAEEATLDAASQAKLQKLISDGGYNYALGEYAKAGKLADQALAIDPQNQAAQQLKAMSREALAEAKKADPVVAQRKNFADTMQQVQKDMVGQKELLKRPDNWDEIKKREGGMTGPGADVLKANKRIDETLDAVSVSVDFRDASLSEVADYLGNQGKVNIQVDPRAKVGEANAADAPVKFKAADMKLRNVLNWVTRFHDLAWTVRDQMVLITSKDLIDEFKVTVVYDIRDIIAPIPDFPSVPEFDMTLPAINARRISDGFYDVPFGWPTAGIGANTGVFFSDFAEVPRYFMTQQDVEKVVEALIEGIENEK